MPVAADVHGFIVVFLEVNGLFSGSVTLELGLALACPSIGLFPSVMGEIPEPARHLCDRAQP